MYKVNNNKFQIKKQKQNRFVKKKTKKTCKHLKYHNSVSFHTFAHVKIKRFSKKVMAAMAAPLSRKISVF